MAWAAIPSERGADRGHPGSLSDPPPPSGAAGFETESPGPENRQRLETLLEAAEEELLDRLGREIAPLEAAAPALWLVSSNERFLPLALRLALRVVCRHLGPESYREVARRFLRRNRHLFRLRICVGWNYCGRRHWPEVLASPPGFDRRYKGTKRVVVDEQAHKRTPL
jgi:hypothetical protein